ncbi:hypothetical protein G9A89_017521 [Geosiphon pyriformis]|nr:hypothetical protein G9A89_017521 [Geosiphon pyriformis]
MAKKGETYRYLSIFLSMKGLFNSSFAKAYADVKFFSNIVFRKAILDKQFFYLVVADVLLRKRLKFKTLLPRDFSNKALCYSSFYNLKFFKQVQAETKIMLVIGFSNAFGILGCLFVYHALDLQILGWVLSNFLHCPVKLKVNSLNNFLAGIVRIFLDVNVSLANDIPCVFHGFCCYSMSKILETAFYFNVIPSLKCFGIVFGNCLVTKRDPIPVWFSKALVYMNNYLIEPEDCLIILAGSSFFCSNEFVEVCESLYGIWTGKLNVFTDGSLCNLSIKEVVCGAVAYFFEIDMGIDVSIQSVLSSTLAELQAIALALECVFSYCLVILHTDSQAALAVCLSECKLSWPNVRNQLKVKRHSDVIGNNHADALAHAALHLCLTLPVEIDKRFLMADGLAVSYNAHHFIHNIYHTMSRALWKTGFSVSVVNSFTSKKLAALHTYLIKAVYKKLPVVVYKRLYNHEYLNVLCLLCDEVEFSDHVLLAL